MKLEKVKKDRKGGKMQKKKNPPKNQVTRLITHLSLRKENRAGKLEEDFSKTPQGLATVSTFRKD